jgi:hypothetical protein
MKGKLKDKELGSPKSDQGVKILWTSHISKEYSKKLSDFMASSIGK